MLEQLTPTLLIYEMSVILESFKFAWYHLKGKAYLHILCGVSPAAGVMAIEPTLAVLEEMD